MADLSDVEESLATIITQIVYPQGTSNPSISGNTVTITPGWPVRQKLDEILLAGNAMISIYPTDQEKVGPIFFRSSNSYETPVATLSAVIDANTVTIGGTVSLPQAVLIIVNGEAYSYPVQQGDTLNSIAAALGALLPSASVVNNVITVNDFYSLKTRISAPVTAYTDLGRQKRTFMLSCWCHTPAIRKILGPALDVYFKTVYRIQMSDNYLANVFYMHTNEVDLLEKQNIFRRDVNFAVMYATTSSIQTQTYEWPKANVTTG
jgi:spore germination protein YaaH